MSVPPSFLFNWLLPKLRSFLDSNPDIEITWADHLTFPEDVRGIDCAIEYRVEPSPRLNSEPLLYDEIVAMAAPEYLSRYAIGSLEDVRGCRLIETERRLVSWDDVLVNYKWAKEPVRMRVALSMHALEAARLGYGIALANRLNASQLIRTQEICIPFAIDQQQLGKRPQYYISTPLNGNTSDATKQFISWLTAAVQANEWLSVSRTKGSSR